jgi:MFS family permease
LRRNRRTRRRRRLAPEHLRGSAFGLLATVQAGGNVIASTIAGLLYTVASPAVAFGYVAACMALALAALAWAAKPAPFVSAQSDR